MNKTQLAEEMALYSKCLKDPALFASEVLGVKLWWMQQSIIRSVFKNRETAVRSCHNSGKTKVAGISTLAWLRLHPPGEALVITTSSSWEQVESEIWGEIRNKLIPASKWQWPKANLTELVLPGGSRAFGLSTNDPVNFHGFHANYVLVIVDEASGIQPEIYDAFDGLKAGGEVHFLYLMNPTEPTGPSVDLFKDPKVTPFTVDGLQTPNMQGYHIYEKPEDNDADPDKEHNILFIPEAELDADGKGPYPFLIRRHYIKEMYLDAIRKYGSVKPEAQWWPRVRGLPPGAGQDQLIQQAWLDQANIQGDLWNKQSTKYVDKTIVAGIDVAGPGENETAMCVRRGNRIVMETAWAKDDPYEDIISILGDPNPNLWIYIDANGIGYGLAAALRRDGYQVAFCNAKNKPVDPTRFLNAKAEWYWRLRESFQDGDIVGPIHPVTASQLLTIKWDQHNLKGLVRIEPKEDAAKRGVPSPDRAEAFMLCFAGGPAGIATGQLVYDTNPVVHGAVIKDSQDFIVHSPSDETPPAINNWLQAHAIQKALNKPMVQAVLNQTTDPIERKKLLALLQPVED